MGGPSTIDELSSSNRRLLGAFVFVASSLPLLGPGCSDSYTGPYGVEPLRTTGQNIIVSSANGCTVEWIKINYDNPGSDTQEFIELKVTKAQEAAAPTLGQCGLGSIVLLNGSIPADGGAPSCPTYLTIQLASVVVPADGKVVICDAQGPLGSVCDVDPGGADFLQNGPNDQISFRAFSSFEAGVTGVELLRGIWEGTTLCPSNSDGGASVVTVPDDGNILLSDGGAIDVVAVWCTNQFQNQNIATAQPGENYVCFSSDAGSDAGSGGSDGGDSSATGGAAGSGGTGGAAGAAGTGGVAGAAGSGGAAGGAGTGGVAGAAGTGGAAGAAGSGGAAGAAGTGGAAGAAGSGGAAGAAGSGGAAGAGATGGAAGAGGTSGSGGAGGSGASGGTGGTSGGSGVGGTGPTDAGDAGTPGAGSGDDGGCGCRVAGRESSAPSPLWSLLALCAAFIRRTRRRR